MATFTYKPLDRQKMEVRIVELLAPTCSLDGLFQSPGPEPRCRLITTSLSAAGPYTALSYVWGGKRNMEKISVNHVSITVGHNLHSALCHLQPIKGDPPKRMWIDALCINQNDDDEKSWQVAMMRDIYTSAKDTIIWLGPSNAILDSTIEYLTWLGARAQACGLEMNVQFAIDQWARLAQQPVSKRDLGVTPEGGRVFIKHTPQRGQKMDSDGPSTMLSAISVSDEDGHAREYSLGELNSIYYDMSDRHDARKLFPVEGMQALFTRAWWSRVWVLQEIVVAKKSEFACGTKRLTQQHCTAALNAFEAYRDVLFKVQVLGNIKLTSYEDHVASATFLPRPMHMLQRKMLYDARSVISSRAFRLMSLRGFRLIALLDTSYVGGQGSGSQTMWSIDHMPRHLEATDPRDNIFGLLGIASDAEILSEQHSVRADYSLSCKHVYTNTAAALIKMATGPSTNLLQWVQFPKRQADLPSWVPDWSVPIRQPLQKWRFDKSQGIDFYPQYAASSGLSQVSIASMGDGDAHCLAVIGILVDTIEATGRTYDDIVRANTPIAAYNSWGRAWITELDQLSLKHERFYGDQQARYTAVIWTTTADMANRSGSREEWLRMDERRRIAATLVLFDGLDQSIVEASGLARALQSDGLSPRISEEALNRYDVHTYLGDIGTRSRGRKPFVTKQGYIGLGPQSLKESDWVAIIAGANVPLVLRTVETKEGVKYQVIGETYLHGVMDGEICRNRPLVETLNLI